MNYHRTLASAAFFALGAIGGSPAAAMTHVDPRATLPRNDATVVSLSVVPTSGRADVVIRVDGAVTLKHFTLTKPDKIVVDMSGATLGLPAYDTYDGVARGGITRIRYSQFTKSVVRVVLTLDAMRTYAVTQKSGEVRVSVVTTAAQFDPWKIGNDAAVSDDAPLARVEPADKQSAIELAGKAAVTPPAPVPAPVAEPAQKLVCLVLEDPRAIALGSEPVRTAEGAIVGRVTSGGFGYAVGASIALAYVPHASAEPGTQLAVDIFGKWVPAEVRAEPLYDPKGERVRA